MRIRSVKPEFFTDRVTGRWPLEQMAFYVALWCYADDEGRFEWEPDAIRGQLFPYKPDLCVEDLLESIEASGRIRRYEVDGVVYGLIAHFKRHQKPNRPVPSKIPALTEDSVSPHGALTAGEEGRGEGEERIFRPAGDPRHRPMVDLFFRLWGEIRGGKYEVQPKDVAATARFLKAHPDTDLAEMERRMRLAFADKFFAQNGSLAWFISKWVNHDRVVALVSQQPARREVVGFDEATGQVVYK